jgi:hypothetical protein
MKKNVELVLEGVLVPVPLGLLLQQFLHSLEVFDVRLELGLLLLQTLLELLLFPAQTLAFLKMEKKTEFRHLLNKKPQKLKKINFVDYSIKNLLTGLRLGQKQLLVDFVLQKI